MTGGLHMRTILATAAIVWAAAAAAQPPPTLELAPDEKTPVVCDYLSAAAVPAGVTCSSIVATTVTVRKGTDATPAGIITSGPTASGSNVTMTIDPADTRHGNTYQVHTVCAFSNGADLACDFLVKVGKVTLR